METLEQWYSGKIFFLNDKEVELRAELKFNQFRQAIINIYGIDRDLFFELEKGSYNSAVMLLESKEYVSIFDFYIKSGTYKAGNSDEHPIFTEGMMCIVSSTVLKGEKYFTREDTFKELSMEITDGVELIGLCPYDLNKNYMELFLYKDIEISVQPQKIYVQTILGELSFIVLPKYKFRKDSMSLCFSHQICFCPAQTLKIMEIHELLNKIVSFFSLLCGENVTVNKLSVLDTDSPKNSMTDYIGVCNFVKGKLHILEDSGIDSTSFKRRGIFKISDFADLKNALNYWFSHYESLQNAQKAYDRILLDEEMKIVTINKFLAGMQLIEGYTQAYADEEQELAAFKNKKKQIIEQLEKIEDKELVEAGLGFSGISFRKAVKEYLYKSSSCLQKESKTALHNKNKDLIEKIINDRNFYTHSSNRIKPQLNFDEMLNVATLCKEFYRILLLNEMGISDELLRHRFAHNRLCTHVFENLLGIKLSSVNDISEFDKDMRLFSDPN